MDEGKSLSSLKNTFRRRKQLEQDIEHVTQEMYKRNLELAETNQTLSLLRKIDTLVLDSHGDLAVLCQQISDSIASANGYPAVAILTRNFPSSNYLELTSFASPVLVNEPQSNVIGSVKVDIHKGWLATAERNKHIDLKHVSDHKIAQHINLTEAEYHKLFFSIPVRSVYLTKLMARQKLVGLMVVGFYPVADNLIEKNKLLIDRLSEAVGVAVDNKLLYEENQRVLERLQRTNEKLKELDETKDEFIGMASHQLRTPLTSVKGYVSMVLDGDAGPLNDQQIKLLDQAFASSQRMVYLIADLLNVSRLKTGKFVIEAKPTDLAGLVESEIEQLKGSAQAKNLSLTYHKPHDFPELMLDETKIRQVIMNFVDNAIYYTPSGGSIKIELTHDSRCVHFMVRDNGLGVPEQEQAHLFTKFYRASNAKKARPDGTGLGLFMAKKVVTVQGGQIVFESKEGHGSTFGFRFPLSKKENC